MPELITDPQLIPVPGGKTIAEYVGLVSTNDSGVSVALMNAPAGWSEPAQQPEFDEFTLVLSGELDLESGDETITIGAGQAVITRAGERVRWLTRSDAQYVAICVPAFSPDLVHRENED